MVDDGINFLKESLAVCVRNGGLVGRKVGERYFALAEAEMRVGRWEDSMDNFAKAKGSMESCGNVENVKYPLTLMKLSQLKLNACEF